MRSLLNVIRQSLDKTVLTSFVLVFIGAVFIGSLSIVQVDRMMERLHAIEGETRNVDYVHQLQNKVQLLMLTLYRLMFHHDAQDLNLARSLQAEIRSGIDDYICREHLSTHPESKQEIVLLNQLRREVNRLAQTIRDLETGNADGIHSPAIAALERSSRTIETLTREINALHFALIERKAALARENRTLIYHLFLVFSLLGLALAFGGYRLHSRLVVRPLLTLTDAATRVREGDLKVRVQSQAHNEIGLLHEAFNTMVQRLQAHEAELLALNHDLEAKVRERTRSLEAAQAELVRYEKLALLGQIAASVNHEIRTPLNVLYLNVQLIRRLFSNCRSTLNPQCLARQQDVQDRLALIEEEIQRISDMLEEFVRYARLERPKLAAVDLGKTLHRVVDMIDERARHAGVEVILSLPDPTPQVHADENKLIQALLNLCTNAFHAMPAGGRLELAVRGDPERVQISVKDNGTGIPESELDKIFLPFHSSKDSGLGFGLSIVQRIVEDHGGTIHCESRVGEGTCFTIDLPILSTPPHEHATDPADR